MFKASTTRRADGEKDAQAAATREDTLEDERERDSDSEDVDLSLRPVRLKRQRGWPKKREARRVKPDPSVVLALCQCLRCDRDVPAVDVCGDLLVYC